MPARSMDYVTYHCLIKDIWKIRVQLTKPFTGLLLFGAWYVVLLLQKFSLDFGGYGKINSLYAHVWPLPNWIYPDSIIMSFNPSLILVLDTKNLLQTSLCLQFRPPYIVAGSLYLAAKLLKVKLPKLNGIPWWMQFEVSSKWIFHGDELIVDSELELNYDKWLLSMAEKRCSLHSRLIGVGGLAS